MPAQSDSDLATGIRAAEKALYGHYGLTHSERMVHLQELALDVRVVEIAGGASGPPILLLHGIASVTAVAVPLLPMLGARRILAIDWPGHGLSDPLVLDSNIDLRRLVVTIIDTVLASFGVERVDVIAHSLGGQFALYYLLTRPEHVRRLVLLGAPGAGFEGVAPVPAMRIMSIPGVGRGILSLPTSRAAYLKNSDGLLGAGALDGYPDEIAEIGYLASKRSGFARSLGSLFRALITPFAVRPGVAVPRSELARIATPTLMIWGDKDVFLTPAKGRASIDAIPGSQLLLVGGGHAPWLDAPDLVGSTIRTFLND